MSRGAPEAIRPLDPQERSPYVGALNNLESQPMDTTPNPETQTPATPTTTPPATDGERPINGERPRAREDADRAPAREARHWFTITELNDMKLAELRKVAEGLGVKDAKDGKHEELVMRVLQAQTEQQGNIFAQGILEIVEDGFGFLRH